jgi:hypothetical protein
MELFPKYFLEICTVLGGLSAIAFFYEKIKNYLSRNISDNPPKKIVNINNETIIRNNSYLIEGQHNTRKNITLKIICIIIIVSGTSTLLYIIKSNAILLLISGLIWVNVGLLFDKLHDIVMPDMWYKDERYIILNKYLQLAELLFGLSFFMITIYAGISFEIYSIDKNIFFVANIVILTIIGVKELKEIEK